jgi:hypothetical protein
LRSEKSGVRGGFVAVNKDDIVIKQITELDKLESIKSLQSTISKLENALSQMTQNGTNTTLVKKRLKAVYIGLATLENVWNQKPHHYTQEDLAEARNVITGLFPSIENSYVKSKAGSPQRTLLERRIKALELAVQAIDDLSAK